MREATAIAHSNIALSKYWGKRDMEGNFPAVPSLSLTLGELSTRTTVRFFDEPGVDALTLNGGPAPEEARLRVTGLLDRVRRAAGLSSRAEVVTANDFPTASGLASSASGFAALALAATRAAGLVWSVEQISDLARRSSASAARSLFGGLVELPSGAGIDSPATLLAARPLVPPADVPLRVVVCVTTEGQKTHGSTDAMRATALKSRLYGAWLALAPPLHADLRAALLAGDFMRAGELAEESALSMHGCALAAGFSYFRDTTLHVMEAVRALRAAGQPVFFTVDAGPHVKAFVLAPQAELVAASLRNVPGVLRTVVCRPGDGARLVEAT